MNFLDKVQKECVNVATQSALVSYRWMLANLLLVAGLSETQSKLVLKGAEDSLEVAGRHLDQVVALRKRARTRIEEHLAQYHRLMKRSNAGEVALFDLGQG